MKLVLFYSNSSSRTENIVDFSEIANFEDVGHRHGNVPMRKSRCGNCCEVDYIAHTCKKMISGLSNAKQRKRKLGRANGTSSNLPGVDATVGFNVSDSECDDVVNSKYEAGTREIPQEVEHVDENDYDQTAIASVNVAMVVILLLYLLWKQ